MAFGVRASGMSVLPARWQGMKAGPIEVGVSPAATRQVWAGIAALLPNVPWAERVHFLNQLLPMRRDREGAVAHCTEIIETFSVS